MASVDNVGLLGERPSHPELLDYLANRLRQLDWSVKGLIREIVLSRAYGLAASHDARAATKDPENRLLWRSNRRRLQAETIRDAVLLASGSLDRRAGGLSLPVGSRGQPADGAAAAAGGRSGPGRFDPVPAHRVLAYAAQVAIAGSRCPELV